MPDGKIATKISGLIDSDMEDEMQMSDNDMMPTPRSEVDATATAPTKKKARKPKASRFKVTKPKAATRKTRTVSETTTNKAGKEKKPTGAKRKALEEQVNGQIPGDSEDVVESVENTMIEEENQGDQGSEDELKSPKTVPERKLHGKSEATKGNKEKGQESKRLVAEDGEFQYTATIVPQSKLQSKTKTKAPLVTKKHSVSKRNPSVDRTIARSIIPESQPGSMDVDSPALPQTAEPTPRPISKYTAPVRAQSRTKQELPRRRAGSASDTERVGGDPMLRRKLGDLTKKFENVDLKYQNLREVGVVEANTNMEKLRKQCEATTAVSSDLIASLKKELATQKALAQETKTLQKKFSGRDAEATKLQSQVSELSTNLSAAQNEIKTLQAKLAASRSASAAVESTNAKVPGSAVKTNGQTRTIMVGSAEAAQAAQAAQLKEDLYSDLTGLILRGVRRKEDEDMYDCIQTGRNGTLHFKLAVAQDKDGKSTSFEDTEFLYTPLLDLNRDKDLLELLPDYLTEDITFSRQHAAKFYSRVVETLTKKRIEE